VSVDGICALGAAARRNALIGAGRAAKLAK
jgi:hypothetical protein